MYVVDAARLVSSRDVRPLHVETDITEQINGARSVVACLITSADNRRENSRNHKRRNREFDALAATQCSVGFIGEKRLNVRTKRVIPPSFRYTETPTTPRSQTETRDCGTNNSLHSSLTCSHVRGHFFIRHGSLRQPTSF